MPKRSISVHLALMFALSALLIVSIIGILLRSSLHDSLQKQMHNEPAVPGIINEPVDHRTNLG